MHQPTPDGRLPPQGIASGSNYLTARRRFAALDEAELRHLMQLVLDESECASQDASQETPELGAFLGTLAAHVGYELWLREQARVPDGAPIH